MQDAYVRLKNAESVKEVALDLGYTQLSNFSRDFKQFYGFSPSLLRRPGPLWSFK
jgi:AraC-like DNA-binding protein